jgi:hypothetical protein
MITSAWMTVLPPRMMFVVPTIWDLRETLLPVSWRLLALLWRMGDGRIGGE